MPTPSPTSAALFSWLLSEGLAADRSDDGVVMQVTIPDTDGRTLRLVEVEDAQVLAVSMVAKARVPRTRWTALYPMLSNVNSSLAMGAWVLDPDREMLVFRLGIPATGVAYEASALRAVLSYVASTVGALEASFLGATEDDVLAAWMAEDEE
ncbi:MAG: hypothetical protein AB8H79_13185 [Myxococcota bacterium]